MSKPTHCDRLLEVLRDGKPHDHHELYSLGMIVHSRVSNLRRDRGCVIEHWRDGDTHFYQLISGPTELPESDAAGDWGRQASSDSGSAGDVGLPAVTSSTDSFQFTGDLVRRPHPSSLSAGDPRAANGGDDLSPRELVSPALSDSEQLNLLEVA